MRMNDPRRPSVADDKRKEWQDSSEKRGNGSSRTRQSSTPDALLTPNKYSQRGSEPSDYRIGKSVPNIMSSLNENYYQESGYRMHQSTQELRPNPNDYYQDRRNEQRIRGLPAGMIPPRKHLPEFDGRNMRNDQIPATNDGFRNDYPQRRSSNERNVYDQNQRRPSNEREMFEHNYLRRPSNEREGYEQNQQRRPSNERIVHDPNRRPSNERNYFDPNVQSSQSGRRPSNDDTRKASLSNNSRQKPKPNQPTKVSGMLDSVLADYEHFMKRK